jgi:site-specific recombinase XerD
MIQEGPNALYMSLKQTHKPYSVKTYFFRVGEFYQWLIEEGHTPVLIRKNPFKAFMKTNAKLFKYVYQKETLDVGYEEAIGRINRLSCGETKKKAFELLATGMRYTESTTQTEGFVIGKGGKRRRIYRPESISAPTKFEGTYSSFYHKLKSVGLKPHTLRKLAATRFVERGAKEADLMALMGWSSIGTAASYLQAKKDVELTNMVTDAFRTVTASNFKGEEV